MERNNKIFEILKKFQIINVNLRKEIYKIAASFSFTIPQLKIIALLAEKNGLRVSDLSVASALSESTVSGIVDRLVKMKSITRKRSLEDRRVVNLYLADESRTEYEKFRKMKDDAFAGYFEGLEDSEIKKIIDGLTILQKRIFIKRE